MTRIVNYSNVAPALSRPEAATDLSKGASAAGETDMQAVADQVALQNALAKMKDEEVDPDVFAAVDDQGASLLQSFLAENSVDANQASVKDTGEVVFDSHDIVGWAKSLFTWWRKIEPAIWLEAPEQPEKLPDRARIGLLGDWGTGLYGAPACARSIENDPKRFDLLVHLGDVYYSGTEREVRERFLDLWPKKNVSISRALNSNHEMYTGGNAYFQLTLKQFDQRASYFAMQNDRWLLIGLDSAYKEGDLADDQAGFVRKLVASAGSRRVILMTHHQLFSLEESQGGKLAAKLGDLLMGGKIFAWYWGHEHRCVVYDQHPTMRLYGRCIGHSGYPYFREKFAGAREERAIGDMKWLRVPGRALIPSGLLLDGPNRYVAGHAEKYGPNGYMSLELLDDAIAETIHAPDGTVLLQQRIA